eukprot:175634-Karenia_brevis.AAC.1
MLTNLRFADDILLVAHGKRQMTKMMGDLIQAAGKVGLEIHPEKTKLLTCGTSASVGKKSYVNAPGLQLEVLPTTSYTSYLGRHLSFNDFHAIEVKHRVAAGWGKFALNANIFCNKDFDLHKRLQLFDTVVTPTVLYGCGAWTLTQALETELRTAQRRMLRKILGAGRRAVMTRLPSEETSDDDQSNSTSSDEGNDTALLEPWTEWLHRVTHLVEGINQKLGIEDWIVKCRRKQFTWAGHVLRRTDGRWSTKLLLWDASQQGQRRQ